MSNLGYVVHGTTTLQSAAVATGNGTALDVKGWTLANLQVLGITSATITFEATIDGTNYVAVRAKNLNTGAISTTATANGIYSVDVSGLSLFRARISAWTTGTLYVYARSASIAPAPLVDIGAVTAGENHLGSVSGHGKTIGVIPTVTAGAYSAGDTVGGLMTFANAARATGAGGVLKSVVLLDDAGQDAELELWLFNVTFTAIADNAAWAPSEADLEKLICVVSTTDGAWRAADTPSANVIEVAQRYDLVGTSIFGQLVTRGTPTYAATDDVTVKNGLLQD